MSQEILGKRRQLVDLLVKKESFQRMGGSTAMGFNVAWWSTAILAFFCELFFFVEK